MKTIYSQRPVTPALTLAFLIVILLLDVLWLGDMLPSFVGERGLAAILQVSLCLSSFSSFVLAFPNIHTRWDNDTLEYPKQKGPGYDYTGFEKDQQVRADLVVDMFRFAWDGYYKYAFPNDDLEPVTNTFQNSRNGWGCQAVDALDTAIIMELEDIVNVIVDFIPTIDFSKTNTPQPSVVSLFETNIRYLGGLLSAYDLLKGPFAHLKVNSTNVDILLDQAKNLADAMKFAFNTKTGIPVNNIFLENQTFSGRGLQQDGQRTAGLAELGTLQLEWQRLSDLTGDPEYGTLVQEAAKYWFSPSPSQSEPFPGLTGANFSVDTGEILDQYGGWTSGNDSAYEYLIKMYVYDPERYSNYSDRFVLAADSGMQYLASSPSTRPDLTMIGSFAGKAVQNYSEQLACFSGGSYILGSTVLGRPDYLDFGLKLSEFCANGYRYAAAGIGPIIYSWNTTELAQPQFQNQTDLYNKAGWFIDDNTAFGNGMAPEAIESWYYAYQVEQDANCQYWRDVGWAYTLAHNRTGRANSGFSSANNVLDPTGGGTSNFQASYMLAEVLKYMFVLQSPKKGVWEPEHEGVNLFVYNTEAHPIRVAAKNPV